MANFKPVFVPVKRMQCKASIVIEGLSGRGKSGLALLIATALTDKQSEISALDTEEMSLNLFEGVQMSTGKGPFKDFLVFSLLPTHGYSPSNYLACREAALEAGAKVFIQDSITHAWTRKDGILDVVERVQKENSKLNKWTAWGHPTVMDEKENIYRMFRDYRIHTISTVRVKEKQELVDGVMQSMGEQQIFMPETKYEPDLVLSMLHPGNMNGTSPLAKVVKSRYAILSEGQVYEFTSEVLNQLRSYLEEGADPEVLRESQRIELITAIKAKLDEDASARGVWPSLKANIGHSSTELVDLPLEAARQLLSLLLS